MFLHAYVFSQNSLQPHDSEIIKFLILTSNFVIFKYNENVDINIKEASFLNLFDVQDILEKVDKLQELSVPTTFFRKIRDIVFIYKQVLQKFSIMENSIKEINEIKLKKH